MVETLTPSIGYHLDRAVPSSSSMVVVGIPANQDAPTVP